MMKPFDLKLACEGAPLVTRDGREVKEFYYFKNAKSTYCCVALIEGEDEDIESYDKYGNAYEDTCEDPSDLFLKSEKKKLYLGIRIENTNEFHLSTNAFISEEEVNRAIDSHHDDYKHNWQIVEVEIDI